MEPHIQIVARSPGAFSATELTRFRELVVEGGEVGGAALVANIANARILVILMQAGTMRGVAALKRPQDSYRKTIVERTGVELSQRDYPFELGYVYIQPVLQGLRLSHQMVASTLQHGDARGAFATVRTDNEPMRATFAKAGFAAAGAAYLGIEGRRIGLLIRPA
jgi:predicted GNAT family N-acyltransferase